MTGGTPSGHANDQLPAVTLTAGTPSVARRIVVALARGGIDLRPILRRVRDAILRPVRSEIAAADQLLRDELLRRESETSARLFARKDVVDSLGAQFRAALSALDSRLSETSTRLAIERAERRSLMMTLERLLVEAQEPTPPAVERRIREMASPIVSVILPTRDRADTVVDAIASVQAQHFTEWELIVVDDGSVDATAAAVQPYLADQRIRYVEQPAAGVSAARNHGLRLARGALIAYLDSDNIWYPDFLAAAVKVFAADAVVDMVYGVLVTEHHRLDGTHLLWRPFDRDQLLNANYIDLNVFIHRKAMAARYGGFDVQLARNVDWDLILRYTEHAPARALPVLAARYRVCRDARISTTVPRGPSETAIKRKWYPRADASRRPRVLYALWQYPQLSETYMEAELRCMLRWGVHVEVWRETPPASPHPAIVPIHDGSLAEAVRRVRPDVIHVHWLTTASQQAETLAQTGVPVTLRAHGFDTTPQVARSLLGEPWVHAMYAFPHHLPLIGSDTSKLRAVPVAFDTTLFQPYTQKDRMRVLHGGAALPTKDIPFFIALSKLLPEHRFTMAGITCTHMEAYVDELKEIRRRTNAPVELKFNVQRSDMAQLVAEAGIYVHTTPARGTELAASIGMPISIAEAMATGAHVLVRDLPELRDYVGDAGSAYRNLEEAAEIIASTTSWSEEKWNKAWMTSVDRAFLIHADEVALRPIFEDWCSIVHNQIRAE